MAIDIELQANGSSQRSPWPPSTPDAGPLQAPRSTGRGAGWVDELDLPWVTTKGPPQARAMPSYAVFFSDQIGVGIYPVQAMDPGHAMDIVRADHPQAQMSVIPAEGLEGTDRWKLLFAWLDAIDVGDTETCGPQPDALP